MDGQEGCKQKTQGVWMSHDAEKNILVFDIEGTDSNERKE